MDELGKNLLSTMVIHGSQSLLKIRWLKYPDIAVIGISSDLKGAAKGSSRGQISIDINSGWNSEVYIL